MCGELRIWIRSVLFGNIFHYILNFAVKDSAKHIDSMGADTFVTLKPCYLGWAYPDEVQDYIDDQPIYLYKKEWISVHSF